MPAIKYTFYNTTTKKQEEVEFYNYSLHLEKFVFLWQDTSLEFRYSVVLSTDKKKLIKSINIGKSTSKKLFLDDSKISNFTTNTMQRAHLKLYIFGYFLHDDIVVTYFGVNSIKQSEDLASATIPQENLYMRYFDATSRSNASFYTGLVQQWTILLPILTKQTSVFESRTEHIIVPRFYHDGASYGFLQHLRYLGKIQVSDTISEIGRVFYMYKSDSARRHTFLN